MARTPDDTTPLAPRPLARGVGRWQLRSRRTADSTPPGAAPDADDDREPAHGKGEGATPALNVDIVDDEGQVVAVEMLVALE